MVSCDITSANKRYVRTMLERSEFEVRRLNTLLKLYEHARDDRERAQSAFAVCRVLRKFLAEFFEMEGRR